MKITVKLIGPFVQLFGFSEKELDVPEGTTADDLVGLRQHRQVPAQDRHPERPGRRAGRRLGGRRPGRDLPDLLGGLSAYL